MVFSDSHNVLCYRTTKLMKIQHYFSQLRRREDLWGQTGRYCELLLQPYKVFISRKTKLMVPSEFGSPPAEEQISCGPAHPQCDTPVTSQQHHRAFQYLLPAIRTCPRRERAVCATPEIPQELSSPLLCLGVNHRESVRSSPKLLIRMLVFCNNA